MIKDLDIVLKNLDGSSIVEKEATVIVRTICINALLATFQDEQIDGLEKANRWKLAMQLHNGGNELSPEEIVLLKKLVGKGWSPLIVGQIYEIFN